jgi:hypothetical protein
MIRNASRCLRPLLVACALAGCSSSAGTTPGGGSGPADGSSSSGDSTAPGDDSGSTGSPGDAGAGVDGSSGDGASTHSEGGTTGDAGSTDGSSAEGSADGGPRDIGSCCSTQTTPGCDDPNLEVCVCHNIPTCCTMAWTEACVLLVQQKYCQPGVRDCVCGTDAGQWAQTSCCTTDWNATCDSVATIKCGAAQGCF